jgi:hypothetical protein
MGRGTSNFKVYYLQNLFKRVDIMSEASTFWDMVAQQELQYGNVSTPELDWGPDIEVEDINN